jgi:hypothetical protein
VPTHAPEIPLFNLPPPQERHPRGWHRIITLVYVFSTVCALAVALMIQGYKALHLTHSFDSFRIALLR